MSKRSSPYEDTEVPTYRTQGQIREILLEHGGQGVAFVSHPPLEAVEAMVPIDGVTYRIRIGANVPADCKNSEQYNRKIWRVLFWHLKSIFVAAETGVLEFREMMMAYVVVKDGRTIGEHILPKLAEAVEGRPERLLGGGKG